MDPDGFRRVRTAFEAARELPEPDRSDYVDDLFGDPSDHELAKLLRRMLAGAEAWFLDPPSVATLGGAVDQAAPLLSGTQLGDFFLERPIGAGGMGDVWEARQLKPARRVALKVLRSGLATERARARFGMESELLARLSHPAIARVYASGIFDDGGEAPRPWFAMELIEDARDLITFARELPVRKRVELLAEVADAVHHGHLRGVVHRDLKPENILVDSDGRVRVIDFGIAHASYRDDDSKPLTMGGEAFGTLSYMSPEQLLGKVDEIDLRCDVHALGVIFYRSLTGVSPWTAGETSWATLAREICEVDPPAPSRVVPGLSPEIDWIVAHALSKDPARRYPSAELFAEDLRRYLRYEPLRAGPVTRRYRALKFARRNRAWVTGGIVAIVLFVLGAAGTLSGWKRSIDRGRELELANLQSEERANRATTLNEFLNEMLRSANPLATGTSQEMTMGEMLDRAAGRVGMGFPWRPDLEAEVRTLIGVSYGGQGRYASAEEQLSRAYELFEELESPAAIRAARLLATMRARLEGPSAALELMQTAHARGMQELRPDDPELGALDSDLAWLLQEMGQLEASLPYARRAVGRFSEAGPAFAHAAASSTGMLARALRSTDDGEATEAAYRLCLELQRDAYGVESPNAGVAAGNFGAYLFAQHRFADALPFCEEAVRIQRATLDEDHPMLVTSLYNFAAVLTDLGRFEEAETISLECLAVAERTFGPDHRETADARFGLAVLYYEMGRFDEALPAFERYADFLTEQIGPAKRLTLKIRVRVAETRIRIGTEPLATMGMAELRALHQRFVQQLGPDDELVVYAMKAAERAGVPLP